MLLEQIFQLFSYGCSYLSNHLQPQMFLLAIFNVMNPNTKKKIHCFKRELQYMFIKKNYSIVCCISTLILK